MTLIHTLDGLRRAGLLGEIDVQFSALCARLDPEVNEETLLAACLVSQRARDGHSCVALAAEAGQPLAPGAEQSNDIRLPDVSRWRTALSAASIVGAPGDYRPLILDDRDRLYLYRYWDLERRLANALLARASQAMNLAAKARLETALNAEFPPGRDDDQRTAAYAMLSQSLCIVSGGPGTGKTTTVVRALSVMAQLLGDRRVRVGLTAPTGKAATRLQAEIARSGVLSESTAGAIRLEEARTVHRLLGVSSEGRFRFGREVPLPLDLLIVDEASMVDLALMTQLFEAMPAAASVVLLGDADQLASVEAGAVLGDICRGAASAAAQPTADTTPPAPLSQCLVYLTHSYRFEGESGIARLAASIRTGRSEDAVALLSDDRFADLQLFPIATTADIEELVSDRLLPFYQGLYRAIEEQAELDRLFLEFSSMRVLCAHRTGRGGAVELNRLVDQLLMREQLVNPHTEWYAGRPVMVTRNDYGARLFNGELGLVLEGNLGEVAKVYFERGDGSYRSVSPARLPSHETVHAMTVHKSQGSEFGRVILVLPERPSPVLSRELLYTAVSRARTGVEVWGSAQTFAGAIDTPVQRYSGLADLLSGSDPATDTGDTRC